LVKNFLIDSLLLQFILTGVIADNHKKQFETTNFPSLRSIFEANVESPGARVLSDESIQSMKEFEGSLILDILDT
jgi:hypothetical protein